MRGNVPDFWGPSKGGYVAFSSHYLARLRSFHKRNLQKSRKYIDLFGQDFYERNAERLHALEAEHEEYRRKHMPWPGLAWANEEDNKRNAERLAAEAEKAKNNDPTGRLHYGDPRGGPRNRQFRPTI
jgi:hypothetical protein